MTKTSAVDLFFFDKPPYYEHEVITNLEELSAASSQNAKELNKNFQNISKTLANTSDNIVSSIENEAERSRIQSAIENERIASGISDTNNRLSDIEGGISETNYRLLDVAYGIEGLGDIVRSGNENIVEAIGQSGEQIVNGLENINSSISDVNFQTRMVNKSLGLISNQLSELIGMISKPNETEALELADQARINLSLNKKEIALKVTRDALELSNGTSVTVLAYHILTLSLFDDEASRKEIVETYEDYVNLVSFKLSDRQSDIDVVAQEIYNTLYPVMAAMGNRIDASVMLLTQTLYVSLYENRSKIDYVLGEPLSYYGSNTLELINQANQFREYHWSILLKEYVINKYKYIDKDDNTEFYTIQEEIIDVYAPYIVALAKSNVLIKNELMILAVKHFYDDGYLYYALLDSLSENNEEVDTEGEEWKTILSLRNDALKVILSVLPQDIIDIDYKTYWALKLFADKENIKLNSLLDSKIIKATEDIGKDVIKEQSIEEYAKYISALAKHNTLIKSKLMISTIEHFYDEGFLYGAIMDSLSGNDSDTLNNALKIILSLLPHDMIDIDYKTYWALKQFADKQNIKVNSLFESIFIKAAEDIKIDVEDNYITFYDNVQRDMYDKEKEITSEIEDVKKEHREVSQKKMREWEEHNKAIADKGYDKKIENAKGKLSALRPKLGSSKITVIFTILGVLIAIATAISAFRDGEIFAGLLIITIGTLISTGIGFVAGIVINIIVNFVLKTTTSSLENSIPEYRKELAKKYNISAKKRKLDAPYDHKIATLRNDLKEYKQEKIDNIDSKLKLLISKYIPIHIEQLSQSENKLKEYIDRKMLGKFIFSKRPNDLKYKQEEVSDSNPVSQAKKKYVEIDIEKLATDYGARWRELHSGEQPTTEKMISWIESLANNGDAKAQYLLGTIYEDDDEAYGIEADKQKALSWFEKAANSGIAEAQCKMGEAYLHGNGLESNMSKALKWFKKARDIGNRSGKYNYGLIKFVGPEGVKKDREKGILWIKEARDDGLQAAQDFITKEGLE